MVVHCCKTTLWRSLVLPHRRAVCTGEKGYGKSTCCDSIALGRCIVATRMVLNMQYYVSIEIMIINPTAATAAPPTCAATTFLHFRCCKSATAWAYEQRAVWFGSEVRLGRWLVRYRTRNNRVFCAFPYILSILNSYCDCTSVPQPQFSGSLLLNPMWTLHRKEPEVLVIIKWTTHEE
jgi:hypothetical protein